ncbi:MAG: flagellar hook-length control protein FliK [Bradyrhizobiaceae bacterium]|nr:flagellar hook-length control protein FliK [Bradyrhizobiaceae bacterium]
MSSVSVIQSAEPRPRADSRPADRGGDVFSEILEHTAAPRSDRSEAALDGKRDCSPAAPVPSASARADALERSKAAKSAQTNKPGCNKTDACKSGKSSEAAVEEKVAISSSATESEHSADAETLPVAAETVLAEEAVADSAASTKKPDGSDAEAVAKSAEGIEQPEMPDVGTIEAVDVDAEAEPEADPDSVSAAAPESDQMASDDIDPLPADQPDDAPEQDAAILTAAAVPSEPIAKAASASKITGGDEASAGPAVNPGNSSQAPRGPEQAPGQQPVHPNPVAAAARENAPPFSDGENPQQHSQNPHQQNPSPMQDAKPAAPLQPHAAEVAHSAAPQIESSPTVQLDPGASAASLQPVRPPAASANPVSFQPVIAADANPVPLTPNAIAVEIVSRMRDGQRRFDIRLDPPELGRIEVRLEVDRHGNVSTRLTVDRPETLDLMQRDARNLERALQQAGLKTDDAGLQFSLRQHGENSAQDGHGKSAPLSDSAAGDEGEIPGSVIESYRASILARGGVDIRV